MNRLRIGLSTNSASAATTRNSSSSRSRRPNANDHCSSFRAGQRHNPGCCAFRGVEQPGISFRRLVVTKQVFHVPDVAALPAYKERDPQIVEAVELGGIRTCLGVPMLKENNLIGALLVYRQEVRLFTDKQIALLRNFAAQAVIAMENARLLKELRERTEQVKAQSQEMVKLNQQLEQRVADQVDEIERMSRLRRFLPPQVADLIVASGSERTRKPSSGDYRALLRPARLYRVH